jgi:probable F420-dependent oxidoreductase
MRFDAVLPPTRLDQIPALAREAEELGVDALWSNETQHDPFLPLSLIAEHTHRLQFGSSIAVAFARSPTTLAHTAWDLADQSRGRFILGLGTQVRAHIVRRFGMPWPESPAVKLREQVQALRAIWNSWNSGERLDFRGKYYALSLMTPFFSPPPIEHPAIPVFLAGVNQSLCRVAGELADGFFVHPFHSLRYLREAVLPALQQGAQRAGRSREAAQVAVIVLTHTSPEETAFVRQQIAFYASTRSYRPVLALHGWQEVGQQLSSLAARGRWAEMSAWISDEMLDTFSTRASPADLPRVLRDRYEGVAQRLALYLPFSGGEAVASWAHLIEVIHA